MLEMNAVTTQPGITIITHQENTCTRLTFVPMKEDGIFDAFVVHGYKMIEITHWRSRSPTSDSDGNEISLKDDDFKKQVRVYDRGAQRNKWYHKNWAPERGLLGRENDGLVWKVGLSLSNSIRSRWTWRSIAAMLVGSIVFQKRA